MHLGALRSALKSLRLHFVAVWSVRFPYLSETLCHHNGFKSQHSDKQGHIQAIFNLLKCINILLIFIIIIINMQTWKKYFSKTTYLLA